MSVSAQQKLAATYLALGWTNAQIAQHIGISERQLYRWQEQSEFSEEVARIEGQLKEKIVQGIEQSGDAVASAIARSSKLLDRAVDVLEEALEDDDTRLRDKLEIVKILSSWHGLASDFNVAMTTLQRYGLELYQTHSHGWKVRDLNVIGNGERAAKG